MSIVNGQNAFNQMSTEEQNRVLGTTLLPDGVNQFYEQTKKLFKAIDDENLEDFKLALEEGAELNAFDEDGLTPLMSLANIYTSSSKQPILKTMAKLLVQHKSFEVNAKSKQIVYEQKQKKDHLSRPVYLYYGEEVVKARAEVYVYCSNQQRVICDGEEVKRFSSRYGRMMESVSTSSIHKDTALHLVCKTGVQDIVKILLTHPSVSTNIINYDSKTPKDCTERGSKIVIENEMQKAKRGKELLKVLSANNIAQAKALLDQEFNPNCWSRNQAGEIETPLSLVIKSCLQGITTDKKEILIKLLKHKDLDFSQIRSTLEMEHNLALKQIIDQAMKEQLIDAIANSDLDRKKELLEGRNSEISSQQIRINQFLKASTQSRRPGNYASIFFVLSGVSVVGTCLSTLQMAVCISFISVAFIFLATGCYYSYKANTALEDVTSDQFIGNAPNISA